MWTLLGFVELCWDLVDLALLLLFLQRLRLFDLVGRRLGRSGLYLLGCSFCDLDRRGFTWPYMVCRIAKWLSVVRHGLALPGMIGLSYLLFINLVRMDRLA